MGMARGMHEGKKIAYRILVEKPQGKIPSERPRHRWEDNIKMDLREVGCGDMDWIHLAQDRDQWRTLVNTVMNIWVPQNVGKFLSSWQPAASQEGLISMESV
jgi:hypothetical protein